MEQHGPKGKAGLDVQRARNSYGTGEGGPLRRCTSVMPGGESALSEAGLLCGSVGRSAGSPLG